MKTLSFIGLLFILVGIVKIAFALWLKSNGAGKDNG